MKAKEHLAKRILRSISVRVTVIVFISSIFSYIHFYSTIKKGSIQTLDKYVNERTQLESFLFTQAEENHIYLKSLITNFLESNKNIQENSLAFNNFFEQKEDKTYRNKIGFDGTKMAGVFIPPEYPLDKTRKGLVVYLKKLAEATGPIFRSNFQDTYFTTPDNIMVIYWPEVPNWTLEMASDFQMTDEEYVWIADKLHNPQRKMVWTGLFYDKVGKTWMTSAETPVYKNDKHVLTIGHDVMLSELLDRAQNESLPGAYNIIFREDGRLIVHPQKIEELKKSGGYFDINKSGDEDLKNIKAAILNAPKGQKVIESESGNELLAFGKIKGPGWYFVTVYPKALITSTALKSIIFVIILAFLSLVLEVILLWFVIKNEISDPIKSLLNAAERMKGGEFNTVVEVNREDELGSFATTFNSMAKAILERDQEIHTYAESLEKKVLERTKELDRQKCLAIESAKMASLGEMAGGIAHEINNPLTILSGSIALIDKSVKNNSLSEDKISMISNTINSTIQRIESIISGLRTFARSGEQDNFQEESANQIVLETLALCRHKLKMLNIDLQFDYREEKDVLFECQRVQISQVLLNLVSNAADSIKENSNKKWVKISLLDQEDKFQLRVEDSGAGIPLKVQEKMFQPFFTTKDFGSGTGLGLSISSGIMKHHSGQLFVDNDLKHTCIVMEFSKNVNLKQVS